MYNLAVTENVKLSMHLLIMLLTVNNHFPNAKVFVKSIIIRSDIANKALSDFYEQLELMCTNFVVTFVEANCCITRALLI